MVRVLGDDSIRARTEGDREACRWVDVDRFGVAEESNRRPREDQSGKGELVQRTVGDDENPLCTGDGLCGGPEEEVMEFPRLNQNRSLDLGGQRSAGDQRVEPIHPSTESLLAFGYVKGLDDGSTIDRSAG